MARLPGQSPFPGMDPYLEKRWADIHTMLIAYTRDAVQAQLPDALVARVEERVYIDQGDGPVSTRRPDVYFVEEAPWAHDPAARSESAAIAEPALLDSDHDPRTERTIHIIDIDGNRVVTLIKFLSPWNKLPGPDRERYLRKRREILSSDASLVEIDLVRAGDWTSMLEPYGVPRAWRTPYRVTVHRAQPGAKLALYPIRLQQRLPVIPIPLRVQINEPDVTLDLQALVDQVYRNGRYNHTDYSRPCDPPLEGEEAAWAETLLR